MDSAVHFEATAPVARLKLDDGGVNVLTPHIVSALTTSLRHCVNTPSISVLILSGNSRALSVGLDTQVVIKRDDAARELLSGMRSVLELLYLSSLRSIIVTEGHATAAGAMLLLVADRRIGIVGSGKIGLSEVRVGLPVPEATQQLVRDRISTPAQYATTALAQLRSYHEALQVGFLDSLHPDRTAADAATQEHARTLAALDEDAYLATKQSMRAKFKELLSGQT